MSVKKQAVKKDERVNGVKERRNLNGNEWQLERITRHPLQIKGNMIVLDRLEMGYLRIFEFDSDGPVYVQLLSNMECVSGATLVGTIRIDFVFEKRAVLLSEVYCKDGYEELAHPMADQVEFFVDYYKQFDDMWIKDFINDKWNLV